MAFTRGDHIYLNNRFGTINEELGDYNNLMNILFHEKRHRDKGQGFIDVNNFDHAEIYLEEISDKSFDKVGKSLKTGILGNFISYLEDAGSKDYVQNNQLDEMVN